MGHTPNSMVKKVQESKAAKLAKAQAKSNKPQKKWTSGKQKDDVSRLVSVDNELLKKIGTDLQKMKIITRTTLVEKYNINLQSAINILRFAESKGVIGCLNNTSNLKLYCAAKFMPKEEIVVEATE